MIGSRRLLRTETDEAGRLEMAGLEQTCCLFNQSRNGMILIGMPGIEKRRASFPRFYSRIGFVLESRPLSASEIQQLLERHWTPPGSDFPARVSMRSPAPGSSESPAATSGY